LFKVLFNTYGLCTPFDHEDFFFFCDFYLWACLSFIVEEDLLMLFSFFFGEFIDVSFHVVN